MKALFFVLLVIFSLSSTFAQLSYSISEGGSLAYRGSTIYFKYLYVKKGVRYAEVSILTGKTDTTHRSIRMNDTIRIGSGKKHDLYFTDVTKYGLNSPGTIYLSLTPNEPMISVMVGRLETVSGSDIVRGYNLSRIFTDENNEPRIEITINEDGAISKVVMKTGDVFWYDAYPFELKTISLEDKTAEFLVMNDFFPEKAK